MGRREHQRIKQMLGSTEEGFPDTPQKMSNVKLARLVHGDERGCSRCFPHGPETSNNRWTKQSRSWKQHRQTRYRPRQADQRGAAAASPNQANGPLAAEEPAEGR